MKGPHRCSPCSPGPRLRRISILGGGQPAQVPLVATINISAITGTSASVAGSINPQGLSGSWWFAYGLTPALGTTTASTPITATSIPQTVFGSLTGLTTGDTYWVALVQHRWRHRHVRPAVVRRRSPADRHEPVRADDPYRHAGGLDPGLRIPVHVQPDHRVRRRRRAGLLSGHRRAGADGNGMPTAHARSCRRSGSRIRRSSRRRRTRGRSSPRSSNGCPARRRTRSSRLRIRRRRTGTLR